MLSWISEHWQDILAIYGGLVAISTIIVKWTKTDKDDKILNKIDLTIQKGEKVGIIGSNGCGKTTLLKIINKTETIEKKRKPADVPAAVVAATIGLAEVSGIANAPIAAFAVPAAPSSGRRKGYFRYVRMQAGRHWWTKYRPTVSGWR